MRRKASCPSRWLWWLPRWVALLALWRGPIPIVHEHDLPAPELTARPVALKHFVRCHGSLWEVLRGQLNHQTVLTSHLGWHWHLVWPFSPDHENCPGDQPPKDCYLWLAWLPTSFSLMLQTSVSWIAWEAGKADAAIRVSFDRRSGFSSDRDRDFLVTLFASASWRAWSGRARC